MPKTRLIGRARAGSTHGAMPGISRQMRSKTSGSTIALRISSSTSGAQRVMEKQPLSPGNTPNFR